MGCWANREVVEAHTVFYGDLKIVLLDALVLLGALVLVSPPHSQPVPSLRAADPVTQGAEGHEASQVQSHLTPAAITLRERAPHSCRWETQACRMWPRPSGQPLGRWTKKGPQTLTSAGPSWSR